MLLTLCICPPTNAKCHHILLHGLMTSTAATHVLWPLQNVRCTHKHRLSTCSKELVNTAQVSLKISRPRLSHLLSDLAVRCSTSSLRVVSLPGVRRYLGLIKSSASVRPPAEHLAVLTADGAPTGAGWGHLMPKYDGHA